MKVCPLDGGRYRSWAAHFGSRKHQRAMHPAGSRKGARANARRERRRVARHQLTESHERRMWREAEARERADREESGRHYFGAWTPWGVSAFMGGHPGRGLAHLARHARRHVRRAIRR